MYSVPKSTPRTAEAAEAVVVKRKSSVRIIERFESLHRAWTVMLARTTERKDRNKERKQMKLANQRCVFPKCDDKKEDQKDDDSQK